MTYIEKLKDPRWQRKRLEVMGRDDFTCRRCGSTTDTLHVHHIRYIKDRDPWDYRDYYLVTLCVACHNDEESEIKGKSNPPTTMKSMEQLLADAPVSPHEVKSTLSPELANDRKKMTALHGKIQQIKQELKTPGQSIEEITDFCKAAKSAQIELLELQQKYTPKSLSRRSRSPLKRTS